MPRHIREPLNGEDLTKARDLILKQQRTDIILVIDTLISLNVPAECKTKEGRKKVNRLINLLVEYLLYRADDLDLGVKKYINEIVGRYEHWLNDNDEGGSSSRDTNKDSSIYLGEVIDEVPIDACNDILLEQRTEPMHADDVNYFYES